MYNKGCHDWWPTNKHFINLHNCKLLSQLFHKHFRFGLAITRFSG